MIVPGHVPVMRDEVVRLLAPRQGGVYVDGTVGLGGHAAALLEMASDCRLIGIDRDPHALRAAAPLLARFGDRARLIHGNYRNAPALLAAFGISAVDGLLLDLGVSSLQLDRPERGFSFRHDGPLDMRMDPTRGTSAAELVAALDVDRLTEILRRYGEERFSARIARAIVEARRLTPLETTGALARVVRGAIPRRTWSPGFDPATRTFQALRIAVNDELEGLEKGLEAGFSLLRGGGAMVVISFHSLEDRRVKRFFRDKAADCVCPPDLPICACDKRVEAEILTRKPLLASAAEVAGNPRARSAKLRAARKVM